MKKVFSTFLVLLSFSCSDDNGGGSGGCLTAADFSMNRVAFKSSAKAASEELVLEYVDADGNNLIENNTYNAHDISLEYENGTRTEVMDLQNEDTKYLVWVVGFSKGKNAISVTLSPSETDKMLLYATEVDFSSCTGPLFAIDSVFYNGEKQAVKKMSDWIKKVSITKE